MVNGQWSMVNGQWSDTWNPFQTVKEQEGDNRSAARTMDDTGDGRSDINTKNDSKTNNPAHSETGAFIRQASSFRNWVTPDGRAGRTGDSGFVAEANRYHLYVALICPWACRTLITLQLKGLSECISVSIVNPQLGDNGWSFDNFQGATEDHLHLYRYMHQLYTHADSNVNGRATVPVLWDKKKDTLVNNESADIIEMLNNAFEPWAKNSINLRPQEHLSDLNTLNKGNYSA
ncbi:MAG: putative glutathione S-transferase [Flavobacteriales bacterium]|jgi:putative glutathione S-transferase